MCLFAFLWKTKQDMKRRYYGLRQGCDGGMVCIPLLDAISSHLQQRSSRSEHYFVYCLIFYRRASSKRIEEAGFVQCQPMVRMSLLGGFSRWKQDMTSLKTYDLSSWIELVFLNMNMIVYSTLMHWFYYHCMSNEENDFSSLLTDCVQWLAAIVRLAVMIFPF